MYGLPITSSEVLFLTRMLARLNFFPVFADFHIYPLRRDVPLLNSIAKPLYPLRINIVQHLYPLRIDVVQPLYPLWMDMPQTLCPSRTNQGCDLTASSVISIWLSPVTKGTRQRRRKRGALQALRTYHFSGLLIYASSSLFGRTSKSSQALVLVACKPHQTSRPPGQNLAHCKGIPISRPSAPSVLLSPNPSSSEI